MRFVTLFISVFCIIPGSKGSNRIILAPLKLKSDTAAARPLSGHSTRTVSTVSSETSLGLTANSRARERESGYARRFAKRIGLLPAQVDADVEYIRLMKVATGTFSDLFASFSEGLPSFPEEDISAARSVELGLVEMGDDVGGQQRVMHTLLAVLESAEDERRVGLSKRRAEFVVPHITLMKLMLVYWMMQWLGELRELVRDEDYGLSGLAPLVKGQLDVIVRYLDPPSPELASLLVSVMRSPAIASLVPALMAAKRTPITAFNQVAIKVISQQILLIGFLINSVLPISAQAVEHILGAMHSIRVSLLAVGRYHAIPSSVQDQVASAIDFFANIKSTLKRTPISTAGYDRLAVAITNIADALRRKLSRVPTADSNIAVVEKYITDQLRFDKQPTRL